MSVWQLGEGQVCWGWREVGDGKWGAPNSGPWIPMVRLCHVSRDKGRHSASISERQLLNKHALSPA